MHRLKYIGFLSSKKLAMATNREDTHNFFFFFYWSKQVIGTEKGKEKGTCLIVILVSNTKEEAPIFMVPGFSWSYFFRSVVFKNTFLRVFPKNE